MNVTKAAVENSVIFAGSRRVARTKDPIPKPHVLGRG